MARLRLDVREFTDLTSWRWVLSDEAGTQIAEHAARLDVTSWQFEAFADLPKYLSWHVAPDKRREDEARIVCELGEWIGAQVLGPIAGALIQRRPAIVRVVVPEEAQGLLLRPLELGHAGGRPLAVQNVTLVMQPDPEDTGDQPGIPAGGRLRVLGLFSLPEGGQPLNLRRERNALVTLVREIAATGKAADARVLQYGVTRRALRAVLAEAEGWDIIHVSGHGAPGELLLETAEGKPDPVSAAELAGMLDVAGERVKLVTVFACWSASLAAAEQRRLLGLPIKDLDYSQPKRSGGLPPLTAASGTLAGELRGRRCAVLAMRYQVDDEFASVLSGRLYDLLADKGQPLPRALGIALHDLLDGASGARFPALSVATPTLFGAAAAALALAAPDRPQPGNRGSGQLKMAGFPPQPERFVGRTAVMARGSAALAARSEKPGVLLHGMPGGGKSACALELAFGHEHAFDRLIWYKAPDEGAAIDGALTDFALTLERYLDDFPLAHVLDSAEALAEFLPYLTELMERTRLLLVIDNIESLLTEGGRWRDVNWGHVVGALTGHAGLGRVVLTSRRVPVGPAESDAMSIGALPVEALPVDALSADEALLLARELPNLSALTLGKVPAIGPTVSQQLARNAIAVAGGHPKLLELAEGQAANPDHLLELVKTGDQEWRRLGGVPGGFFATGEAPGTGEDYLQVLAAWTKVVSDMLTPGERDLFWLLCCLEEPDRERFFLDGMWPRLWQRLGRSGGPPGLGLALAAIAARGLVAVQSKADADASCAVHPGVAAAGRIQAGQAFRDATDAIAAACWSAMHDASGEDSGTSVHTGWLVRAGLGIVPYLIRQHYWHDAAVLLEGAFVRDPSRANATAVLPAIRQITRHDPRWASVLARVLAVIDPAAGEAYARAALHAALDRGDHTAASAMAGQLADRCRLTGRLAEAVALTEQQADYTRLAGLGPWTQLGADIRRLRILNEMGRASQVLAEVTRLRAYMDTLAAAYGADETISPWDVRERLFGAGRDAASQLGQWDSALDLNAAITASMRGRAAPPASIARTQFNDYAPLLGLSRTSEAIVLLQDCLAAFRSARDTGGIAHAFSGLADAESQRGHGDAALRFERDALRYAYLAEDVPSIAISYHNQGIYLRRHASKPCIALASHVAAALIRTLEGGIRAVSTQMAVREAATDLRKCGDAATPPAEVADLCDRLADIPGTDLPRLLANLSPSPESAEQALRDLIAQAGELAATAEDNSPDQPADG